MSESKVSVECEPKQVYWNGDLLISNGDGTYKLLPYKDSACDKNRKQKVQMTDEEKRAYASLAKAARRVQELTEKRRSSSNSTTK